MMDLYELVLDVIVSLKFKLSKKYRSMLMCFETILLRCHGAKNSETMPLFFLSLPSLPRLLLFKLNFDGFCLLVFFPGTLPNALFL